MPASTLDTHWAAFSTILMGSEEATFLSISVHRYSSKALSGHWPIASSEAASHRLQQKIRDLGGIEYVRWFCISAWLRYR